MERAILRRGRPRVYVWTGSTLPTKVDLSGEVVQLQAAKSLGSPAGTFSLTLRPDVRDGSSGVGDLRRRPVRYRDLRPNQLISIGMDEDGGIMLGLIDQVRRSMQTGSQASLSLVISGRDLGKALAVDNVVRGVVNTTEAVAYKAKIDAAWGSGHPLTQDIVAVWGPESDVDGTPTFYNATVQDVIDFILANAPSMTVPILAAATGGEGTAGDYVSTDFSVTSWNDGRIWSEAPTTYQGSIWGYVQSILDIHFYEVWLDTVPNESALPNVTLVVRPKPFDEPDLAFAPVSDSTGLGWNDLTTMLTDEEHHEIGWHEVVAYDLGVSDAEAVAYYLVTAQNELIGNPDGLSEGLIYPLVDLYVGKLFGLRSYEAPLTLLAGDLTAKAAGELDYDGEVADDCHNFRNRLFNWHRLAPWFEAGTVQVLGRDRFRVGDPVFLPWYLPQLGDEAGVRFYCTAVSWSWSVGGTYLSTLTLTRGHNAAMVTAVKTAIALDGALQFPPNPDNFADT